MRFLRKTIDEGDSTPHRVFDRVAGPRGAQRETHLKLEELTIKETTKNEQVYEFDDE